jgi:hypothetical protein
VGFWTFVFILICVASVINELFGTRKPHVEERPKPTPQPQRSKPAAQQSAFTRTAEGLSGATTAFTSICQEISHATTRAQESMARHIQVEEATKRLRHEVMTERVLIETAMKLAESQLQEEKKRSAMSPTERAAYDEAKIRLEKALQAEIEAAKSIVIEYHRPNFVIPYGDYDDAMSHAISNRINSLRQERESYIAQANKKLNDARLAAYFTEKIQQHGGLEIAKLFDRSMPKGTRSGPHLPEEAEPQDVPAGRTAETSETGEAIRASATKAAEAAESNPAVGVPEVLASIAKLNRARAIKIRAGKRGVPYLLHFTQVENLPSIIDKGLLPVTLLDAAAIPFRANDRLRLDRQKDAVSLSIAHPNDRMFAKYRWQNPQQKWVVLVLDPSIMWLTPTAFNRNNAADKRMTGMTREERMSTEAFDNMFLPADNLPSREANHLMPFDPTDVQAELLVFGDVSPLSVTGVVFGDEQSLIACEANLGDRRMSVHSEGTGFFGARAYARKTGWTY